MWKLAQRKIRKPNSPFHHRFINQCPAVYLLFIRKIMKWLALFATVLCCWSYRRVVVVVVVHPQSLLRRSIDRSKFSLSIYTYTTIKSNQTIVAAWAIATTDIAGIFLFPRELITTPNADYSKSVPMFLCACERHSVPRCVEHRFYVICMGFIRRCRCRSLRVPWW